MKIEINLIKHSKPLIHSIVYIPVLEGTDTTTSLSIHKFYYYYFICEDSKSQKHALTLHATVEQSLRLCIKRDTVCCEARFPSIPFWFIQNGHIEPQINKFIIE